MAGTRSHSIIEPRNLRSGAVFSSPHSGRTYPPAFVRRSRLGLRQLRSSEDAFVDELFAAAPACGAPLQIAHVPRAIVDLNRSPGDLDPLVVKDARPAAGNPRVAAGLGVIPRVVTGSQRIHRRQISAREAESLLLEHHHPYHSDLGALMRRAHRQFGRAVLIDCHSMPRASLRQEMRPEIVLGDRHGASCSPEILDAIDAAFVLAGFRVARNSPYAGGYIAELHGRPEDAMHVVQVEIDRSIYMDEAALTKRPEFTSVRSRLDIIICAICDLAASRLPLAAE